MSVEDPNSLQSHQYSNIIDLITEGPIGGLVSGSQSIYLNGTPVQNTDGSNNFVDASGNPTVTFTSTLGTASQAPMFGTAPQGSETNVAVKVYYGIPIVQHITTPSLTRVRVTIQIPALNSTDTSTGDIHGNSVHLKISVSTNGGAYVVNVDDTINGKCMSVYNRQYMINLPTGTAWDIKMERMTADSISAYDVKDLYWKSYTSIIDVPVNYPYSALVGIQIDSQYFSSIPTRGYHIKGLLVKIPSNYNPITRVYTGTWDGTFTTAWTNNPAWCYYDMLTNPRYGLGKYISAVQVDKWSLYSIAQYCDALVSDGFGGYEPRFTCNLFLQTAAEAYTVLANMASIFRGVAYWLAGQVTATQDSPTSPTAIFTLANVVNSQFNYSGTSLKARHTVALVSWNDPQNQYQQKVEYVEDVSGIAKYGVQQTQITAFGCTSRGQAHRLGLWTLYAERLETETITFKAGLDHVNVLPGAVIQTSDPNRAGTRMGGRITASTSTSVTPDGTIYLIPGKSYTLSVMLPSGTSESHPITNSIGTSVGPTNPITISGTFTATPNAMAMYVLVQNDLVPEQWRVLSIVETDPLVAEITALKYDNTKYAAVETGVFLTAANSFAALVPTPSQPTNMGVKEMVYQNGLGVAGNKATVYWTGNASTYIVSAKNISKNTNAVVQTVTTPTADFYDMVAGDAYYFSVTPDNVLGIAGTFSSIYYSVVGKTAPPSNVGTVTYIQEKYDVHLYWPAVSDFDVIGYEVRVGASWTTASFVVLTKDHDYQWLIQAANTYNVMVCALDSSGHYSATPSVCSVVVTGPAISSLAYYIQGVNEYLQWTIPSSGFTVDHYEIRYGTSWAAGTYVDTTKATGYQRKADYAGSRTYWVAAIDAAGNVGPAASVTATITVAGPVVFPHADVVDNNVLIFWGAPTTGTLPVASYEVRKGASWAVGTVVGSNGNSTFTSLFEQQVGDFTYWISGVDSAGNYGAYNGFTTHVNTPPGYLLTTNYYSQFYGSGQSMASAEVDTYMTLAGNTIGQTSATLVGLMRTWLPYPLGTKLYYEFSLDTLASDIQVGVMSAAWSVGSGHALNSLTAATAYYYRSAGYIGTNGTEQTVTAASTGSVVGVQVDQIGNTITFFLNGVQQGTAITLPTGPWYPAVSLGAATPQGGTINFGATALKYGTPPGYNGLVSNAAKSGTGLILPVNTTETWTQHFVNNSWSSPQDQINAGGGLTAPLYIEPALTSSVYTETYDFGNTIPATNIVATLSSTVISGAVAISCQLQWSLNGSTWSSASAGATAALGTNFRYVRMTYTFSATGTTNILSISSLNLKLSVKQQTDSGTATVPAGQSKFNITGSAVNNVHFQLPFVSTLWPSIQPNSSVPLIAQVDYDNVPADGFNVTFYTTSGALYVAPTGGLPFTWNIQGY